MDKTVWSSEQRRGVHSVEPLLEGAFRKPESSPAPAKFRKV